MEKATAVANDGLGEREWMRPSIITHMYKVAAPVVNDFGELHIAAKSMQGVLEDDYDVTLGYIFGDGERHIESVWDDSFQSDIERWDALGFGGYRVVPYVLGLYPVSIGRTIFNYFVSRFELHIGVTEWGEYMMKRFFKADLKPFGNYDILVRKMSEACACGVDNSG